MSSKMDPLSFIHIDWLTPLWKRLLQIRRSRSAELGRLGDVFGDPVQLARYYVQPNCQQHNPADSDEVEAISHVQSPVFDTINKFLNREIAIRDGKSQMFILSDAGMGKTSLLLMLKLAHITSFWPRSYECVLLKLGTDTLTTIRSIEGRSKVVLLLDALDEDPVAFERIQERLKELLEATFNFYRVIISCRTQFFPGSDLDPFGNPGRVVVAGFSCPMIFLSLFDEKQVDEYLRRRFPGRWYQRLSGREPSQQSKARRAMEKMGSLRLRPLLLAHIEDILESGERIWDEYSIYDALVNTWLLREHRKFILREGSSAPAPESLLKICVTVAEQMYRQGIRTITLGEIEQILGDQRYLEHVKGLDIGGRSLLNRDSAGRYRLSHYSIQEFLLAVGVANGHIRNRDARLRPTANLVRFLLQARTNEFNLSALDLTGVDLTGRDFSRQRITHAVLDRAILRGVSFRGANLSHISFQGADLSGVTLQDACLIDVNFTGADLSNANLINVDLQNSELSGVNTEGVQIDQNTKWPLWFDGVVRDRNDHSKTDHPKNDEIQGNKIPWIIGEWTLYVAGTEKYLYAWFADGRRYAIEISLHSMGSWNLRSGTLECAIEPNGEVSLKPLVSRPWEHPLTSRKPVSANASRIIRHRDPIDGIAVAWNIVVGFDDILIIVHRKSQEIRTHLRIMRYSPEIYWKNSEKKDWVLVSPKGRLAALSFNNKTTIG